MKSRVVLGALLLWSLSQAVARASEQVRGANALESGKFGVTLYGAHAKESDLEFKLSGANLIQVPLQGGGTAQFFANANTTLKFDGEGDAAVVRLSWRPGDGLQYGLKFGTGDYELRVPSQTVTNVLKNGAQGRIWGADAAWTIVGNSPVTPAVSLALGYTRSDYAMGRLDSGGTVPVDQRFSLEEWQGAVAVSKRWRWFEPYGGLRVFRQTAALLDEASGQRVRGTRTGLAPYAGARLEWQPKEGLVVEISGADETIFAAGLSIGF